MQFMLVPIIKLSSACGILDTKIVRYIVLKVYISLYCFENFKLFTRFLVLKIWVKSKDNKVKSKFEDVAVRSVFIIVLVVLL